MAALLGAVAFGRSSCSAGSSALRLHRAGAARAASSMKLLKARLRTVLNMQKITKAMKMVAASKLKHDQRRLEEGTPFSAPVTALFERLPREQTAGALTILGVTSDKGLCGGVNSQVSRECLAATLEEEVGGGTVDLLVIGSKGLSALTKKCGSRLSRSFEELSRTPWSFASACLVAERLIEAEPERLLLVSNQFRSVIAYDTTRKHCVTMSEAQAMDRNEWSKAMDVYTFEPPLQEVWQDLHEFYYACIVYRAGLESAVCEQTQRMNAMQNATKNAGEMIDKLSLEYNRARQARITSELCEIISGASAV